MERLLPGFLLASFLSQSLPNDIFRRMVKINGLCPWHGSFAARNTIPQRSLIGLQEMERIRSRLL